MIHLHEGVVRVVPQFPRFSRSFCSFILCSACSSQSHLGGTPLSLGEREKILTGSTEGRMVDEGTVSVEVTSSSVDWAIGEVVGWIKVVDSGAGYRKNRNWRQCLYTSSHRFFIVNNFQSILARIFFWHLMSMWFENHLTSTNPYYSDQNHQEVRGE